ncbi:hypothetical protein [Nocardia stercoris]|uniref:N-terminal of MaoC-like dehydratase domain-containing protein n=1 Tax=Nocardia stercoris TaxID=2483361 RepID=A0A3M2KQQ9_9NOCA|nr:hypothetical protein [Nocardia stercoris]RMI27987.1 hypothetical protein EBN03_32085 [Nocardia stercoris]
MPHVAESGRIAAPVDLELRADAIRAFAAAAGADAAEYFDAANPVVPPTFLSAERMPAGSLETDHCFFTPPPRAGDRLTVVDGAERTVETADGVARSESVTRYYDRTGRLIAESWASAPTDSTVGEVDSAPAAARLAAYATDWLGAGNVRRFRTRSVAAGEIAHCSGHIVQQYVRDREPRVDVTLVGTDRDGAVVIRAWATFAQP